MLISIGQIHSEVRILISIGQNSHRGANTNQYWSELTAEVRIHVLISTVLARSANQSNTLPVSNFASQSFDKILRPTSPTFRIPGVTTPVESTLRSSGLPVCIIIDVA